ncbi:unnamed protein product [Angiostrongylus costaricensis]|uniref:Serine protease K12H4.7 n=1 Tax=Angiostrongylus costaricensis TaxID=334426 RepID=A0A0R3PUZ8_ANGCS|nr:unnamed protein product [Angiostrongylus costaricensis]
MKLSRRANTWSILIFDKSLIISATLQHFGNSWFLQRYQYNSKFYNKRSGNVFLMIGGERSISPPGDKWVRNENVMMMKYAKIYGAAAFQLEHRHYGPAEYSPMKTQTTLDLKLLTIDQVIEDIREFIRQMNAKYFNGTKTYWVTFGGSYSGALSAFYRETYPETSIGAVSTSSAVNVLVDYYGQCLFP